MYFLYQNKIYFTVFTETLATPEESHSSGTAVEVYTTVTLLSTLKVTVQFETEGNGQNKIISPMDRSELKL